jgi:hypothetical protein
MSVIIKFGKSVHGLRMKKRRRETRIQMLYPVTYYTHFTNTFLCSTVVRLHSRRVNVISFTSTGKKTSFSEPTFTKSTHAQISIFRSL